MVTHAAEDFNPYANKTHLIERDRRFTNPLGQRHPSDGAFERSRSGRQRG